MSPERLSRESWEFFREEGIEEKKCRGAWHGRLTKTTGAWHERLYILKATSKAMDAKKFFTELKRRKVYRVA
ncbi:MAG: hypothetical protein QOF80_673, partial [Verrucomicrobiota bacterium]